MVPLLAKNAVKIKVGFPEAGITGNYECAYGLGIISATAGLVKEENIQSIAELKNQVMKKISDYEPGDDSIKRLIEMLGEYEPAEKTDQQMIDLYYVGFDDKNL